MKAEHPIWRTVHVVVVLGAIAVILAATAQTPDITEVKAWGWIAAAVGGGEIVRNVFSK